MQIFATCMECLKELGHPSFEPFFVPYYEDRIGYITCSRGHTSAYVIQNQKFEVLMDSGANALAAGFTLEACASFSAALERLFEFALKAIAVHRGMTEDLYNQAYKEISRQSERQLGAFLFLFALQFGSVYKPNKEIAEFRNSVIHKGLIPTPDEARQFCQKIYAEVIFVTQQLRASLAQTILEITLADLRERNTKIDPNLPRATVGGRMFFSLNVAPIQPSFDKAFQSFQDTKGKLMSSISQIEALHHTLSSIETNSCSPTQTHGNTT